MRRTRTYIFLAGGLLPLLLLTSCAEETLKVEALYSASKTQIAQISYAGEATLTCRDILTYDTVTDPDSEDPIYHFQFNEDISLDEVSLHDALLGRTIEAIQTSSDRHEVTLTLGGDCTSSSEYDYGWVAFEPSCFVSEQYSGYTVYCRVKTGDEAIITSMSSGNVDLP